jgi:type II secretory pathway pseudopilin PulG
MKTSQTSVPSRQAFSRLELVVVLFTLALLVAVALPVLASTRPRADRITCVNNLRQIGKAFNSWASDHYDLNPWFLSTGDGGNSEFYIGPLRSTVWFQFSWVSNELESPKILADPADSTGRPYPLNVATSWDNNPNSGLLNAAYQNYAVSYFLGTHANFPRSLLCGDRNVVTTGKNSPCFTTLVCTAIAGGAGNVVPDTIGWTNAVHRENGNLLFDDGQVRQLNSAGLRKALDSEPTDGSIHHFLFPF